MAEYRKAEYGSHNQRMKKKGDKYKAGKQGKMKSPKQDGSGTKHHNGYM